MVRTPHVHCRGTGSIPIWGTKVLHAMWHGQKKKKNSFLKEENLICGSQSQDCGYLGGLTGCWEASIPYLSAGRTGMCTLSIFRELPITTCALLKMYIAIQQKRKWPGHQRGPHLKGIRDLDKWYSNWLCIFNYHKWLRKNENWTFNSKWSEQDKKQSTTYRPKDSQELVANHFPMTAYVRKGEKGTSLVVQCLGLWDPNAGGPGLIPGQGTRSHMMQLKILHAARNMEDFVCRN